MSIDITPQLLERIGAQLARDVWAVRAAKALIPYGGPDELAEDVGLPACSAEAEKLADEVRARIEVLAQRLP